MIDNNNKKTLMLVHGAWSAPYTWSMIEAGLKNNLEVVVVQLPGHGSNYTAFNSLHMSSYIEYVSEEVKRIGESVILVGHSMAGMIISGVAELIPDLIEKLVYIAAYLPQNGESAYALSLLDKQSLLGASLIVSADSTVFDIKLEDVTGIFCQDATEGIKALVLENYRSEPGMPFGEPVELSENNFGRVDKYYIQTLQDNGIGNILQKEMIASSNVKKTFELNSGHTPMLSVPSEVCSLLQVIALN